MKKRSRRKINEISILQKYSSNKFLQNSIISQLNISILQKYSSNRMKTNKEIAHKIYFNTTKVLFKPTISKTAKLATCHFNTTKVLFKPVDAATGACLAV